ncbi:acyltransferase family protein [Rhodoblastus sp.]|uniref:acyltransferase family protein n=1 Tax=Rhodoblastus sp. TaxID=1962975 RepID=UPI003F96F589
MAEIMKRSIEEAPRRREVAGVDLLRFAAAFMVMLFHLGFWGCAAPHSRTNSLLQVHACFPKLAPFASAGWIGVEIFFVISGFVITWSAQNASPLQFVASRILRLAPAAWICATLTACVALAFTGVEMRDISRGYLRTLAFYPTAPWIDDAYWTLGVEIAFYMVVAAVLAFGRRAWITAVVGAIGAASASFWILRAAVGTSGPSSFLAFLNVAATSRYTELALLQHGCFFCIGAILCASMGDCLSRPVLALALFCGVGGALEIVASAASKSSIAGADLSVATPLAIWALAMLAIVASIRLGRNAERPSLSRWARRIGLMTYPLYLLHSLIGSIAIQTLIYSGVSDAPALVLSMALAVALALVVSEVLEPAARGALARGLFSGIAPPSGAIRGGLASASAATLADSSRIATNGERA